MSAQGGRAGIPTTLVPNPACGRGGKSGILPGFNATAEPGRGSRHHSACDHIGGTCVHSAANGRSSRRPCRWPSRRRKNARPSGPTQNAKTSVMEPHRVFYHADIAGTLSENQELRLGADGLSCFGRAYAPFLRHHYDHHAGHIRRELMLERIRTHNPNVSGQVPSRLCSVFAALSIHDAKVFAHRSENRTSDPIRIFEIIAPPNSFYFRDMGWLWSAP